MSNVIDFLERMGRDAQLRYATGVEIQQVLADEQIEPAVRAAIMCDDQLQLEVLLGATTNVCCMVHPAEESDDEDDDDLEDDDDEDELDDEEDELKSRRAVAVCATTGR